MITCAVVCQSSLEMTHTMEAREAELNKVIQRQQLEIEYLRGELSETKLQAKHHLDAMKSKEELFARERTASDEERALLLQRYKDNLKQLEEKTKRVKDLETLAEDTHQLKQTIAVLRSKLQEKTEMYRDTAQQLLNEQERVAFLTRQMANSPRHAEACSTSMEHTKPSKQQQQIPLAEQTSNANNIKTQAQSTRQGKSKTDTSFNLDEKAKTNHVTQDICTENNQSQLHVKHHAKSPVKVSLIGNQKEDLDGHELRSTSAASRFRIPLLKESITSRNSKPIDVNASTTNLTNCSKETHLCNDVPPELNTETQQHRNGNIGAKQDIPSDISLIPRALDNKVDQRLTKKTHVDTTNMFQTPLNTNHTQRKDVTQSTSQLPNFEAEWKSEIEAEHHFLNHKPYQDFDIPEQLLDLWSATGIAFRVQLKFIESLSTHTAESMTEFINQEIEKLKRLKQSIGHLVAIVHQLHGNTRYGEVTQELENTRDLVCDDVGVTIQHRIQIRKLKCQLAQWQSEHVDGPFLYRGIPYLEYIKYKEAQWESQRMVSKENRVLKSL